MAESPTDGTDSQSSVSDDTVLDDNQTNQSADEHTDTGTSGDTQDSGQTSDNEPQHGTTQDNEGSDDDGLDNFAEAQGFDPKNLTEGERKALKIAHDNQKAYRKSTQGKSEEAQKAIEEANTLDDGETEQLTDDEAWQADIEARQARIESNLRLSEFYSKNPDARGYDKEMGEIVLEEANSNGKAAARYLAADLNRLLVLAKARRGDGEANAIAEQARKEERERIRKAQEAGSDGSQATNSHQGEPKITQEWVDKEYDPSNPEHRQMVDEAIQRGDLY